MKNLFLFFYLLIGLQAYSNPELPSDSLRKTVLKQLGLNQSQLRDDLWAEKVLPYAKTQKVLVVPVLVEENESEGISTLNAVIVVVNNQTGKILQKYPESNLIFSDAIYLAGFTIDTAPYMLTKETRAFGVRAKFYGRSNANPYMEVKLSLFVQEGKLLRCVLNELMVESSSGEWNMDCNGQFYNMKSILSFEPQTSKNYFNLVIKERNSVTFNEKIKGNCEEKTTNQQEKKKVLHYDGTYYL